MRKHHVLTSSLGSCGGRKCAYPIAQCCDTQKSHGIIETKTLRSVIPLTDMRALHEPVMEVLHSWQFPDSTLPLLTGMLLMRTNLQQTLLRGSVLCLAEGCRHVYPPSPLGIGCNLGFGRTCNLPFRRGRLGGNCGTVPVCGHRLLSGIPPATSVYFRLL